MDLISVDLEKCKGDGMCAEACPTGRLTRDAEGRPRAAPGGTCIECGHCVAVCPHAALSHALLPREGFEPAPARGTLPGIEAVRGLMVSRRSVREFRDQTVPRQDLERLLDIARHAPTATNSQNIRWIVTLDPARTRRLSGLVADWWSREENAPPLPDGGKPWWVALKEREGREAFLRRAPHLAVACAPSDYAWANWDGPIAVAYLELAAASMGLGACWAGLITRAAGADPAVIRELGLPEGQQVCGGLMLGLPKYRYRLVPPRKELRADWL